MTRNERELISEFNTQANFNIQGLIRDIVESNGQSVRFTQSRFSSDRYEIIGRIVQEKGVCKFTVDQRIFDTPYARYAHALLLSIYTEVFPLYPRGRNLVYITSDWIALSDYVEIKGKSIQSMLNRTAREILINDTRLEEEYNRISRLGSSNPFRRDRRIIRDLADIFNIPETIIRYHLDTNF